MRGHKLLLFVMVSLGLTFSPSLAQDDPRPRFLVLTDISSLTAGVAEPDDGQSLIRLMLYSNEFDIEGLIATSNLGHGQKTRPDQIRQVVDAYEKVRPDLIRHDPRYPPAEALRGGIKAGKERAGPKVPVMESVGEGKDTQASDWIIRCVDRPDPRPLWVVIWGGSADWPAPQKLVQAKWESSGRLSHGGTHEQANDRPGCRACIARSRPRSGQGTDGPGHLSKGRHRANNLLPLAAATLPRPGRLTREIKRLARRHQRYGYRRIHALLVRGGWTVNIKRVRRLWNSLGLRRPLRLRKPRKLGPKRGTSANSCVQQPAQFKNDIWTCDFIHDRTVGGRPLKWLTLVDEYTRECLVLHADV